MLPLPAPPGRPVRMTRSPLSNENINDLLLVSLTRLQPLFLICSASRSPVERFFLLSRLLLNLVKYFLRLFPILALSCTAALFSYDPIHPLQSNSFPFEVANDFRYNIPVSFTTLF